MSVQIGVINLLAVLLAFFSVLHVWKKQKRIAKLLSFFILWFFLLCFLMVPLSLVVWNHMPLMSYFQFPWRFLSLIMIVCPFLGGSIVLMKWGKIAGLILAALAMCLTLQYTNPAYYMLRSDRYYTSRSNFIDSTNSPGNSFNTVWGNYPSQRPMKLFLSGNPLAISHFHVSPLLIEGNAHSSQNQTLTMSRTYFPNWKILLDKKAIQPYPNHGLIQFFVPKGNHHISVYFANTSLENIAACVSIVSLLVVLFFLS